MIHDVIGAVYKGDYRIELKFDDGKIGVIDFTKYLNRGGVFKKLKNLEYFRSFKINKEIGTITWFDELDIAPETLYAEATGDRLPSWMETEENIQSNHRVQTDSATPCR